MEAIDTSRTVRITRRCPFCGKHHEQTFNKEELDRGIALRDAGALMQDAFPNFSPSQREFLMTGICDACWDNM